MNTKSAVAKPSPNPRARRVPVRRRRLPGTAGRAGASRRAARLAMRGRATWVRPEEWDGMSPCAGGDHEIDPAFDEVGDIGCQVDALSAHTRHAATWDRSADDGWGDVG